MPPRFSSRNPSPSSTPPSAANFSPSIGRLYKDIKISPDAAFAREDLQIPKEHWFVVFCKNMYKRFPGLGKGAAYTETYQNAISFLGWKLKPEEFSAAVKGTMLSVVIVGAIIAAVIGLLFGDVIGALLGVDSLISIVYLLVPVIIVGVVAANYIQSFPLNEARREQLRALTYVPEIIGYLIMSMKLVPNLEKAVEFAAEHGRGRISQELRRIIWGTQIGIYNTVAEGLDELAYNWGKFSSEFKQALMNIRASVLENTESKRYQILDKTMEDVLESVQNKMEQFARDLSQPSTLLFYVGVLLPLILIIILPVGSAFSGSPLAQTWVLLLVYDVVLPLIVIWFSNAILQTRPPTYTPPEIPDGFPGLPPRDSVRVGKGYMSAWILVLGILIVGVGISSYAHFFGIGFGDPQDSQSSLYLLQPDKTLKSVLALDGKLEDYYEPGGAREGELKELDLEDSVIALRLKNEKAGFLAQAQNDITAYNFIFGLLITFGIAVGLFFETTLKEKLKMQQKYMQMESEFKDSLYVMASRLGENKPIEDALRHTQSFLPNSLVSQEVFGKTVDNIHVLGMPLEAAVFDPSYGALRNNPSKTIASSMKIAIDSVRLGVGVAARTLISLSRQLSNSERVSKMLTTLIKDITGTMKTVSVYVAPIVLGITTSLQRVVIVTLTGISATSAEAPTPTSASNIPGVSGSFTSTDVSSFIKPEIISTLATPGEFILIVAIYVIELVLILNYYITLIEDNNSLTAKINAARSLPIALIIFVVTVIISNSLISTNFGS